MKTLTPKLGNLKTSVLAKAVLLRMPEVQGRIKVISEKIARTLRRKTSQKIHLKIDLKEGAVPAIHISSIGLISQEYGRHLNNEKGVVSEAMSEFHLGNFEVPYDE